MSKGTIAVVGGGLAGLMATLKIVEAGLSVNLFLLFLSNGLIQHAPREASMPHLIRKAKATL